MRSTQGVNAPAFGLAACHQGTDADDFVKRVLGKPGAQGLPSRSQAMTDCSGMGSR
jgi:hypothetical protein